MLAYARSAGSLVVVLLLAPSLAAGAAEGADAHDPIERALEYVASRQQSDGRWPLPSQGYVVEALGSAGVDPKAWPSRERSAFSALTPESDTCRRTLPSDQQDCIYKSVARIVHAAGSAGYDARALNGIDGVQRVRDGFVGGQFGQPVFVNDDVWAILALRAAGVPADDPMVRDAAREILEARADDGGWAHNALASRGDVDMTGMALAALAAAGEPTASDDRARDFLLRHWRTSGAFGNCQSTVWGAHGLALTGAPANETALDFLRGLQRPDGGFSTSGAGGSDLFCTIEVLVLLAGERYPLPSYAPLAAPASPVAHALEEVAVESGMPRAQWAFADGTFTGGTLRRTFPAAGVHPYELVAGSDAVRGRASGAIQVLSARPQLGAFPASVVVHRPAPLAIDLANASDPDGRIVRVEVDWGDGNVTNGTTHAYARPGEYNVSVRAEDDAGVWSRPAGFRALVPNRAPVLAPLPARVVGDRVSGAVLHVDATDPDGDAVEGVGARVLRPATLGAHVVTLHVTDEHGARAHANVTVEIVNLPPSVRILAPAHAVEGEEIVLAAEASDPDGPAPSLAWSVGTAAIDASASRARARLPAGEHLVRVVATDRDGARATATHALVVRARDAQAPVAALAAEIHAFDARLEEGALVVSFDATGEATLRWRSDLGEGEARAPASPARVEMPGVAWALASLEVTAPGGAASRTSGLLVPPAARAPPPPMETSTAAPVVVQPSLPPLSDAAADEALAPAAFIQQAPQPARETPLPALLALAAIALATRGRRAR